MNCCLLRFVAAEYVLAKRNFEVLGHCLTVIAPAAENLKHDGPPTILEGTTSVDSMRNLDASTSCQEPKSDLSIEDLSWPEGSLSSMPMEDTVVVIENLPPDFDEDDLDVLIDNPNQGVEMDGSISSVELDNNSRTATVNFSSPSGQSNMF